MWREEQLQLKSVNDQKKKNKAQQTKLYQRKVLQTVKSWGGPCTTVDELNRALQKDGFDEETIVIQELINFRLSNSNTISPQDRPLLKIRKIPHATRYSNLCILLDSEEEHENERRQVGSLPTNRDALCNRVVIS